MKNIALFFLSMAMLCCTASATTTDELVLSSGSSTATFQDNVGCITIGGCGSLTGDTSGLTGTLNITGTINGWTITLISGVSKSPNVVPQALNVSSFTASCNAGQGCASGVSGELDVKFSDINFSVPVGAEGFLTTDAGTVTGGGVSSTSQSAYFDNNNTLFAETSLIGTAGPFSTATFNGSATGGTSAAIPNYSMTLDQVFIADPNGSSFNVDGNVKAGSTGSGNSATVPEPGALVLFGSLLALCAAKLRRRAAWSGVGQA